MKFELSLDEFIAQYRGSLDLHDFTSFGGGGGSGNGGNESNSGDEGNEGNEGDENNESDEGDEGDEGNEGNFFNDLGSGLSNLGGNISGGIAETVGSIGDNNGNEDNEGNEGDESTTSTTTPNDNGLGDGPNGVSGWFDGVSGNEGNENNEHNEGDEGNEGNIVNDFGSAIANGFSNFAGAIESGAQWVADHLGNEGNEGNEPAQPGQPIPGTGRVLGQANIVVTEYQILGSPAIHLVVQFYSSDGQLIDEINGLSTDETGFPTAIGMPWDGSDTVEIYSNVEDFGGIEYYLDPALYGSYHNAWSGSDAELNALRNQAITAASEVNALGLDYQLLNQNSNSAANTIIESMGLEMPLINGVAPGQNVNLLEEYGGANSSAAIAQAGQQNGVLSGVDHNEGDEGNEGNENDEGNVGNLSGGFSFGKPIVIDLDGDGVEIDTLDESTALFDFDEDGFREKTAWVSKDDGLLMVDLGNDGKLTDSKEIAFANFTENTGDTDLEALREVFDTNGDDVLNALDEDWELFKVWQDANQNGITDEGELMTLDEVGITEISLLARDGTGEVYSDGTTNHGLIDVIMEDGSVVDAGDIGFATETDGVRETTDADGNTVVEYESGEPGTGERAPNSFVFVDDGQLIHHIQAMGFSDEAVGAMEYAVQDGDNVSFVRDGITLLTVEGVTIDSLVQSLMQEEQEDAPLVAYDGDNFHFDDTEGSISTDASTASALTAQAIANGVSSDAGQSDILASETVDDVTESVDAITTNEVA